MTLVTINLAKPDNTGVVTADVRIDQKVRQVSGHGVGDTLVRAAHQAAEVLGDPILPQDDE